jgi:uncharacterized protein
MWVPTDEEIRELHERHAPDRAAFELVFTHCRIVCLIAEQLAAGLAAPVDLALVQAGCLLHDIGVYRVEDRAEYIRHGVLGRDLLRAAGLPEVVCRFCSCHTGVGITRDDVIRQRLPIPLDDYVAGTEEELLVMYADKFHSKSTPPRFVTAASYQRDVRRFGEDKAERFAALVRRFGEPELAPLAERFGHHIV